MDKLCLSVLNYYKSQIVSLWSIYLTKEYTPAFRRISYTERLKY